jgi:hypothetical protein
MVLAPALAGIGVTDDGGTSSLDRGKAELSLQRYAVIGREANLVHLDDAIQPWP